MWKKLRAYFELKIFCKVAVLLLVSVLLSFGVELIYNIHALRGGYPELDITSHMEETDNEIVCEYVFDGTTYLNKFKILGDFAEDSSYTLDVYYVNNFGVEEVEQITDQVYMVFPEAYTNINKNVNKITMRMEDVDNFDNIKQIVVSNNFIFNKYRLLLYFVVFFLVGLVFLFRSLLMERLELFFIFFSIGFGVLIILLSGPRSVTWDEQIHYGNVYKLASDHTVDWTVSAWANNQNTLPGINTKEELFMLKQYLNENGKKFHHTIEKKDGYEEIILRAYFPMTVFYKMASWLGVSYSAAYSLGRLGNLMVYVLLISIAIHIARERKILVFAFSVLPTVLFQGSVYTYDGIVYSFTMLGIVLLINEIMDRDRMNIRNLVGAIIFLIIGSYSKAVYIPLLLLVFALPNSKFLDKKQAYLFKVMVAVIFVLMMGTFVLPALSNTIEGNLSYGDSRGGDTSVARQIISMFMHPLATVRLFVSNILTFDNFRNLGYSSTDNVIATNLMFLNFASLGSLKDKWSFILIPLLCLLFFVPSKEPCVLPKSTRIWCAVLLAGTLVLVWMALYLSFTPVGSELIEGVQARYYFPLLVPLSLLTWTGHLKSKFKEKTYNSIVVGINGLLMYECIYQLILKSCCF